MILLIATTIVFIMFALSLAGIVLGDDKMKPTCCVLAIFIPLSFICGVAVQDKEWTQYVIDKNKMEYVVDEKTGRTLLVWK